MSGDGVLITISSIPVLAKCRAVKYRSAFCIFIPGIFKGSLSSPSTRTVVMNPRPPCGGTSSNWDHGSRRDLASLYIGRYLGVKIPLAQAPGGAEIQPCYFVHEIEELCGGWRSLVKISRWNRCAAHSSGRVGPAHTPETGSGSGGERSR